MCTWREGEMFIAVPRYRAPAVRSKIGLRYTGTRDYLPKQNCLFGLINLSLNSVELVYSSAEQSLKLSAWAQNNRLSCYAINLWENRLDGYWFLTLSHLKLLPVWWTRGDKLNISILCEGARLWITRIQQCKCTRISI